MSRPARQSMMVETISTPTSIRALPSSCRIAVDEKRVSASTSPSMRSMSWPALCSPCQARSRPSGVAAQVHAQRVADPPGESHRQPGDEQLEPVTGEGGGEEGERDGDEGGGGLPVEGGVDEVTHEDRPGERERHGDDEHERERDEVAPLRAQPACEQPDIGRRMIIRHSRSTLRNRRGPPARISVSAAAGICRPASSSRGVGERFRRVETSRAGRVRPVAPDRRGRHGRRGGGRVGSARTRGGGRRLGSPPPRGRSSARAACGSCCSSRTSTSGP